MSNSPNVYDTHDEAQQAASAIVNAGCKARVKSRGVTKWIVVADCDKSAEQSSAWTSIAWTLIGFITLLIVGLPLLRFLVNWAARELGLTPKSSIFLLSIVCVGLALLVIEVPILLYIYAGQSRKRGQIKNYYNPDLIAAYFYQFIEGRQDVADVLSRVQALTGRVNCLGIPKILDKTLRQELQDRFDDLLGEYFGRQRYLLPMIILTVISTAVLLFGFQGGFAIVKAAGTNPPVNDFLLGINIDIVAVAAIFGAYTWVVGDAITRSYQGVFDPAILFWYSMRFVIAVPLGESLASVKDAGGVFNNNSGATIAFLIGMFSFDRIKSIATSIVNRVTGGPAKSPDEDKDLVVKLPGIDQEMAEKLDAEGLTTIAEIASIDPIRLSVRTGVPFDTVIKIIDAAILWEYVDSKLLILREMGWKGASNVVRYAEDAAQLLEDLSKNHVKAIEDERNANVKRDQCQSTLDAAESALKSAQAAKAALVQGDQKWPAADASEKAAIAARDAALKARDQAQVDLDSSGAAVGEAKAALLAAQAIDKFIDEAAAKTTMTPSGLRNIIGQISRDSYAHFITAVSTQ